MAQQLRILNAQINPKVGDIAGNVELIRKAWQTGRDAGADLVVTPEMSITGYSPDDLLLKPDFIDTAIKGSDTLRRMTTAGGPGLIVGGPEREQSRSHYELFNAAWVFDHGKTLAKIRKQHLPNYGVFDEKRYFAVGGAQAPVDFRGHKLGLMVCEDTWYPDVAASLAKQGAEILLSINASPYEIGKDGRRLQDVLQRRARETGLGILYTCQIGGQDQIVFDGSSMYVGKDGKLGYHGPHCQSALDILTFAPKAKSGRQSLFCENKLDLLDGAQGGGKLYARPDAQGELYEALVLAIRDYFHKNGFENAVLGMSGGMDSALVAALAVDALGPDRVLCLRLPSTITSSDSMTDAADAVGLLGCRMADISIGESVAALRKGLEGIFGPLAGDGTNTLENLQARTRGALLMAATNKTGKTLLLSTGNKSEVALGYCTLYGDMCGGYNPLKDVYKTSVYALARWRNTNVPAGALGPNGRVVPEAILVKPPSAELSPGQTDAKGLGAEYSVIDPILSLAIDHFRPVKSILAAGHDPVLVKHILRLLDGAEFKRQQACPGPKVTHTLFGRDWRMPVTNGFRMSALVP